MAGRADPLDTVTALTRQGCSSPGEPYGSSSRILAGFTVLMGSSMDAGRLLRDLVFYNLPYLATAGLCWWAPANTRSSRRAWRLLAVAIPLATAERLLLRSSPSPRRRARRRRLTISTLPATVATIALVLLIRDRSAPAAPTVWLDRLVIGLGSAAVAAALVPAPLLRLEPPTSTQAISNLAHPVAYPLVDLTLLIVLATVGGVTRLRVELRLALLALGLGIALLTDLAYLRLDPAGHSDHGDPVDLGRLLALVPLAAAAASAAPPRRPHRLPVESTEHAATTPPTVAALAALTVLMAGYTSPSRWPRASSPAPASSPPCSAPRSPSTSSAPYPKPAGKPAPTR